MNALREHAWRSSEARETFEKIDDLLRREVLDQQFAGMKAAMESQDPETRQRVKDMLADLNAMLAADARGEDTDQQFNDFMAKHGDFFPEQPESLEELVDALARRAAAAQQLMDSLTPEQQAELQSLMAQAMGDDVDLQSQLAQLNDSLRSARPDLQWGGRQRMRGEGSMGLGDATGALAELAQLSELGDALDGEGPPGWLDQVDDAAVERLLGRQAVDDLAALQRVERELTEQGYLTDDVDGLQLTPKAVRRLGDTALRTVFARLRSSTRGDHDQRDAGAAGDLTGASRPWQFGDEQPLDVVRTVRNALLRQAGHSSRPGEGRAPGSGAVRLDVEDFEVAETERRSSAAVVLAVDLSSSMALRGDWGRAKSMVLALHTLVSTRYPQDHLYVVGFSRYAWELTPTSLVGLGWDAVQGTNLHHALSLAGRFLGKHPDSEPVVIVVTDGEPTAHLEPDGHSLFWYPPLPETIDLTMAEVEKITRRGAAINVFMLDDDPRLVRFVQTLAKRNGGRVVHATGEDVGAFVVEDYLRARRGRGARGVSQRGPLTSRTQRTRREP